MAFDAQPAIRTAEALSLGVTRDQLAGPRWQRPMHGVVLPTGPDCSLPRQRVLAAAATLSAGMALGGWAAALLHGATHLDGIGPDGKQLPIPVVVPPPASKWRRGGMVHLRSALDDVEVVEVDDIAVTAPVRTAFDLARLSRLPEAVVALDAMSRQLRIDMEAVRAYTAARPYWRGVPIARAALALTDPGTRSNQETRLRMVWILDAGLPRPLVNATAFDADGHVLGEADLLDVEAGVVVEYDGAHHRDQVQHGDDNAREEFLEAAGLIVVRAGALDLGSRRLRTIHRLEAAHARGSARDRRRDRWTYRPRAR